MAGFPNRDLVSIIFRHCERDDDYRKLQRRLNKAKAKTKNKKDKTKKNKNTR